MVLQEIKKEFYNQAGLSEWAQPFVVKVKPNNDTLAILVHGFSSSPYIMHNLADYLASQGVDVEAVLLAGHGRNFKIFGQADAQAWHDSVEKVLQENLPHYKNIYLIGHSLGASVCVSLAADYPQVKGLISLGISVYLRGEKWIRFALPFAKRFKKRYKKSWLTHDEIEQLKKEGRRVYVPVKSVSDLYRMIDTRTKKKAKLVKTPTLIIHSRKDQVSQPKSSEFLFQQLELEDKEIYILDKNSHGLLQRTRNDYVFAKMVDFIKKHN
ncbi:alpha/beta fold hydrolase [Candidatus Parcubacteria bacterium]|nr:MAG: alpha/beta fold hydrolase [Candidatus Parcubacteria bacterium]